MPNSVHSALVKPFELSSWAGILFGPNALMPAAVRSSTIPAARGVSGPTTTSSTAFFLQKAITAAWSATSSATHSASRAIPALPGAHQNLVTRGEAAIFHARACSRPPEPSRRMCIEGSEMRDLLGAEVARIGAGLKGAAPELPVIPALAAEARARIHRDHTQTTSDGIDRLSCSQAQLAYPNPSRWPSRR